MLAFVQAGLWAFVAIGVAARLHAAPGGRRGCARSRRCSLPGLATLGICVLIDLPLNFANIIALPLLFGIGVAFNIYFVMAWRHRRQRSAAVEPDPGGDLQRADHRHPRSAACGCRSHPGTASMGELLALSLACTLVSALVFLPALLGEPRADAQ